MDELWEMLTLLQTGKLSSHHLILIYGRKYWDQVLNWKAMVRWGTISQREYNLLEFADTVDEAFHRVRRDLQYPGRAPAKSGSGGGSPPARCGCGFCSSIQAAKTPNPKNSRHKNREARPAQAERASS